MTVGSVMVVILGDVNMSQSDWKRWDKEKPPVGWNYLWMNLMACDCCVDACGVMNVFDSRTGVRLVEIETENGPIYVDFECHSPPIHHGHPFIQYWRQIDLPR
jgi:hypothetical protein